MVYKGSKEGVSKNSRKIAITPTEVYVGDSQVGFTEKTASYGQFRNNDIVLVKFKRKKVLTIVKVGDKSYAEPLADLFDYCTIMVYPYTLVYLILLIKGYI